MTPEAEALGLAWIEKWSHTPPKVLPRGQDLDFDYPGADPRTCLDAILFVLSTLPADSSNPHFGVLAAGPLENLLVKHGSAFLDEIDVLARRDPAFRLLLNGAWLSDAPPEVVTRLAKYRTAPW